MCDIPLHFYLLIFNYLRGKEERDRITIFCFTLQMAMMASVYQVAEARSWNSIKVSQLGIRKATCASRRSINRKQRSGAEPPKPYTIWVDARQNSHCRSLFSGCWMEASQLPGNERTTRGDNSRCTMLLDYVCALYFNP